MVTGFIVTKVQWKKCETDHLTPSSAQIKKKCSYASTGSGDFTVSCLTLILLTWRMWWAPNNTSKWQMGFNLAFKGLINQAQGQGYPYSLTPIYIYKHTNTHTYIYTYVSYNNKHNLYNDLSVWFVLMLSSLRWQMLRCVKNSAYFMELSEGSTSYSIEQATSRHINRVHVHKHVFLIIYSIVVSFLGFPTSICY